MRDLRLLVPADCVAANTAAENAYALAQMHKVLKADTRDAAAIAFATSGGRPTIAETPAAR